MIYFAQAKNGLIKIGWTESVLARVASLESEVRMPVQLLSAVEGDRSREATLHAKFASVRVRDESSVFGKEWYLPAAELLQYVASLPVCVDVGSLTVRRLGAKRLQDALSERQISQNAAARELGVKTGVVCRWLNGERVPDIDSAARIEDVFGIPMRDWARETAGSSNDKGGA